MSYIGRFFKWSFDSVISILRQGVIWSIRQAITIIRFALPYMIRIFAVGIWLAFQLSVLNLLALVRPIPDVARKAAEEWSDRAVRDGWFPSLHQLTLTEILCVVAILAMSVGLLLNLFIVLFTGILIWEFGNWLLSLF